MTAENDKRKHKPSAKHALEQIRSSLEDLIRNGLEESNSEIAQDNVDHSVEERAADTASHTSSVHTDTPAQQKPTSSTLDTGKLVQSLNELIGNELTDILADEGDPATVPQESASVDVTETDNTDAPVEETTVVEPLPAASIEVPPESESLQIPIATSSAQALSGATGDAADGDESPPLELFAIDDTDDLTLEELTAQLEATTTKKTISDDGASAEAIEAEAMVPESPKIAAPTSTAETSSAAAGDTADGDKTPSAEVVGDRNVLEVIDLVPAAGSQQAFTLEDPTLGLAVETHKIEIVSAESAAVETDTETETAQVTDPDEEAASSTAETTSIPLSIEGDEIADSLTLEISVDETDSLEDSATAGDKPLTGNATEGLSIVDTPEIPSDKEITMEAIQPADPTEASEEEKTGEIELTVPQLADSETEQTAISNNAESPSDVSEDSVSASSDSAPSFATDIDTPSDATHSSLVQAADNATTKPASGTPRHPALDPDSRESPLARSNVDVSSLESSLESRITKRGQAAAGSQTRMRKKSLSTNSKSMEARKKKVSQWINRGKSASKKKSGTAGAQAGRKSIPVLNNVVARPGQNKPGSARSKKRPASGTSGTVALKSGPAKKKITGQVGAVRRTRGVTQKDARLRKVAIRVIATLNVELRKRGENALNPRTIDRLQYLLREALEQPTSSAHNNRNTK